MSEQTLIDTRQLCQRWGWNEGTPAVLRTRGTLPIPYIRIGKSIRYKLSDVIEYEQRQTVAGKGGAK